MTLLQIDNYVLNHYGQVYDLTNNECIYQSSYEDAKEFLLNITS